MNFSVERLRIWLLVGAGLLVAVIGAFLGYAHYRAHRFLTGLPGKMGMDIQQETNAFTYSQSVKGKTIYTIHAAKALKRKDGKVTLNDVGIVLYGRGDGSNSDRVDRIYGKEFEYDQTEGVVRAMGEVHIDLQAPAPVGAGAKVEYARGKEVTPSSHVHDDDHLIHVKTSGLVFLQKLGVAATDQDLEFEFNGMTGHAHGADFSSDTGLLVLQSAVKVNGVKDGKPTVLTASRAELDRQRQQVLLSHAVYTVVERDAGPRIAKGERVTAYLRHEGGVDRAQAEGGVSLTDAGGTVSAQRGEVHLSAANQPQAATLAGDVRFATEDPLRQAQGQAQEGRAAFDTAGTLQHVTMSGGVRVHERTRGSAQDAWGERDLTAQGLELAMASGDPKHVVLKDAKAAGDAKLTTLTPAVAGAKARHTGATSSALSGDVLMASFVQRDGGMHVKDVHGAGHTTLWRVSDTGAIATSSGDALDATFRGGGVARGGIGVAGGAKGSRSFGAGGDEIVTAVQQGHVVMTNKAVSKVTAAKGSAGAVTGLGSGGEQKATASRASYDGATEKMTLTGAVQVSDGDSMVSADRVVMEQQTGNAMADGAVKASYSQLTQGAQTSSSAEVVHVLAARGELKHDAGLALFYGVAGQPARLWQGASQVEAPVLQFEQKARRMVAKADGPGLEVHAVFVNAGSLDALGATSATLTSATSANPTTAKGSVTQGKVAGAKRPVPVPVRVASHEMTYSDLARRADFSGGVLVEDGVGTMRALQATVFLQAAAAAKTTKPPGKEAASGAFLGGSVERVVASGRVDMVQPGRRATGEQVVYTAADGLFVLTGLPGLPPRMMDETRGQITGASMSFHAGDNGVVVANGPDGATGQRVRTVTRVKQ
ncbi:MAG: OstA family protein [Acidobacteriaceae bacterium]|nr:OstA family protein [Acidobacteriaceae bacterium]